MKKFLASAPVLLFFIVSLSGCSAIGDKSTSLTVIYAATAVLSLLLLIGCCCLVRKNKAWLVLLFSSVLVVNVGYTVLAMSTCLEMALWANRVAYLGSVFLPLSMLMIILQALEIRYRKWLPYLLIAVSIGVLRVVAQLLVVFFDTVDENDVEKYLDTDEAYDKAGAYAIQGYASLWINGIEGDYFNVVGLPVHRMCRLHAQIFKENLL